MAQVQELAYMKPATQAAADADHLRVVNARMRAAFCVIVMLCGLIAAVSFPRNETQATGRTIRFGLNPETAAWHDFALLPRIGETLGRRIVRHRTEVLATRNGRAFEDAAALTRVHGIGTRTVRRLRPFLCFAPPDANH